METIDNDWLELLVTSDERGERVKYVDPETVLVMAKALLSTRKELAELKEKYPRAMKLMNRGDYFLVIAKHEPYFRKAYEMICEQKVKQGTWTEEDEQLFLKETLPPTPEVDNG